jgi:hypothetical protein
MVVRLVFGIVYVVLGALGVALLLSPDAGSEADRYGTAFFGSLLAIVSAGGLALVVFIPLFALRRPGPVLGIAPSGVPAAFFRRSRFMLVTSVLVMIALAGWLGAAAVVLFGHGEYVWAALAAGCALVLLRPPAVLVTGRVGPGGLWLTRSGVEYRKEAVHWTLAWSDLQRVERNGEGRALVAALPHAARSGVAAVEPLVLVLDVHARPQVRRTTRRVWSRECSVPPGMLCVDCFDLAGGREQIAGAIERYRTHPALREHLGTAAAVSQLAG